MKQVDIDKRLATISGRKEALSADRTSHQKLRGHVRSGYFQDALAGKHPYLTLSTDRATYLERQKAFGRPVAETVAALMAEARNLPAVTGPRWDQRRDVCIGIIADQFLYDSLKDAAHFVPLSPRSFETDLQTLDILLITSAWRGLDGEWARVSDTKTSSRKILEGQIIPRAKELGIPVVYYSKEDPPNFNRFSNLGRKADHIFTTAEESVPGYHKKFGEDRPVAVLPFAVNPSHHNPMGCMRHQGREILFAGSWFEHKYYDRREAAQRMFDGLLDANAELILVDRNLELDPEKFPGAEKYLFPERYLPFMHGPIDHDSLLALQRLLPTAINLNSVTGSQTMFANRVIELQAMGTAMISNYSAGVNSQYPQVMMPDSRIDASQTYSAMTVHSIREAQVAGIRAAFTDSTAFDRIDTIVEAVGLPARQPEHNVYVTGDDVTVSALLDTQVLSESLRSRIVRVGNGSEVRGSEDGDLHVHVEAGYEHGPHIIQDAVNAFRYSDADCVALRPSDSDAELFEYGSSKALSGAPVTAVWVSEGRTLAEASTEATTSVTVLGELRSTSTPVVEIAGEPELTVVVPVYNNGPHLKFKCFESLRRSTSFERSEILLVDDGSSDPETQWILHELESRYSNVRLYQFPVGGSGSASRPRNKGLELARAPYITYLDPDNEQTNDGFAFLLDEVKARDIQFAIGNMLRFKGRRAPVNNYGVLRHVINKESGEVRQNALSSANYQPMSIQALVARTDWLRSLGISQPLGAVGQDSYFFQQMLYYADRVGIYPLAIHTYYAAISSSTVNSVSPRFYEKYLPLEEDRADWLKSIGLLDDYNSRRLEKFVKGWYVKKLSLVAPEDRAYCTELIRQLVGFYEKTEWSDPELTEFFARTAPAR